jgi:hypothetical protein
LLLVDEALSTCSGNAANLDPAECEAWQELAGGMGIPSTDELWKDPCVNADADPEDLKKKNVCAECFPATGMTCSKPDASGKTHLLVIGLEGKCSTSPGFCPGTLTPAVGKFPHLLELSVGTCKSLHGSIPDEIGQLKKLQKFTGYLTCLSGPIPTSIGGCTNLVQFRAGLNSLSGAIPASMVSLPMVSISLAYTDISEVPPGLYDMPSLTYLELYGSKLEECPVIPATKVWKMCFFGKNPFSKKPCTGPFATKSGHPLGLGAAGPQCFFDIATQGTCPCEGMYKNGVGRPTCSAPQSKPPSPSLKAGVPLSMTAFKAKMDAEKKPAKDKAYNGALCALNFGSFVDGILNSIVYVWSASKRCSKAESEKFPGIACVEDVSASIQSCMGSLDNLVSLLKPCGWVAKDISLFGPCVDSIGGLLANTAGLVKSSAQIADYCTEGAKINTIDYLTPLGKCFSNIGTAAKSLLSLSITLSSIAKHKCTGKTCTAAILILTHVASVFGESFAHAFDNCALSEVGGKGVGNRQAECTGAIFGLVDGLTGLAADGYTVGKECKTDHKNPYKTIRRYIEGNDMPEHSTDSNSMTFAIAAAIPLAAVVSFIGGWRFAKSGARSTIIEGQNGINEEVE